MNRSCKLNFCSSLSIKIIPNLFLHLLISAFLSSKVMAMALTAPISLQLRAHKACLSSKSLQPRNSTSIPLQLRTQNALGISETFTKLRQRGKVALIPYIMAGDPDLSTTAEALKTLDSCGCSIIELGVPNSNPFMDGPVIQASCTRALSGGTNFRSIMSMLKRVVPKLSCPISLFTYYNVILEHDVTEFMAETKEAGVHGLVVPDVPLDDIDALRVEASKNEIEVTLVTTPLTPKEQMKHIVQTTEGFVYLVSSVGVTGVRPSINPEVPSLLQEIKQVTTKPVAVGFGISEPKHVQQLATWGADGVVVGSAIVKLLGEAKSPQQGLKELETLTMALKSVIL